MCTLKESKYSLSNITTYSKVTDVELSFEQCLTKIQELVMEYEETKTNYKSYETQYLEQKEKCESKTCSGSLELKQLNEVKDNIIQSIASAVTKLNETRDFKIINEIFSIICGEHTATNCNSQSKVEKSKDMKKSPEAKDSICDESVSEIEGTPTGRKSPIIFSKVTKNIDKKRLPDSWCTPESKIIKLSKTPSRNSNGRLVQTRLTMVKSKPNSFVDLTSSPELKSEKITLDLMDMKQEDMDDETIMPSPSGIVNFHSLQKSLKCSPHKTKKLSLKSKLECAKTTADENIFVNKVNPDRFKSPLKLEVEHTEQAADESISLLQQMCKFDTGAPSGENLKPGTKTSPSKQPLAENNNIVNIQNPCDLENSLSILRHPPAAPTAAEETGKRPKAVEPVYKEPTVRKKAEKRALKGWSCDECKIFYDELYMDDPEKLAKKMEKCSKHRGRCNPVRPKTPPGYWDVRWDVPTDTEAFNRRNDAL